jgi:hypothetical protein
MRRIGWIGVVLLLSGCQSVVGPRQRQTIPGVVDDPRLSIREQERKGRDRLALPDESPAVAPRAIELETPWIKSGDTH